jgi:hypothetical protein
LPLLVFPLRRFVGVRAARRGSETIGIGNAHFGADLN